MATAFLSLLQAAQAALLADPPVAGGRVSIGQGVDTPLHDESDVTLSIAAQDGREFTLSAGPTDWTVDLSVDVRARGSDTVDAVAAIDPVVEAAWARLHQLAWPAGVMGLERCRARLDTDEAATPYASWQLVLTLTLRTAPGSLALAP